MGSPQRLSESGRAGLSMNISVTSPNRPVSTLRFIYGYPDHCDYILRPWARGIAFLDYDNAGWLGARSPGKSAFLSVSDHRLYFGLGVNQTADLESDGRTARAKASPRCPPIN